MRILGCGFLLLLVGCAHQETQGDMRREIDHQDLTIRELTERNNELMGRLRVLETELETLRAENVALKRSGAAMDRLGDLSAYLKQLEEQLGRGGADFTVHQRSDGVAVEIADTVLFKPGQDELSDSGKRVLLSLSEKLRGLPNDLRVEGHTDTDPVVVHAREFPMGNLHLSLMRSLNVGHFLTGEGQIPADRVSCSGFGEHKPVAENTTRESKAKNRRVEIVILKPEGSTPK